MSEDGKLPPRTDLRDISTRWSAVHNPAQFVLQYAAAIRNYLVATLRDEHDAEDVLQEFLLGVTRNGFPRAAPHRGRFRDYLFMSIRNAALAYRKRQQTRRRRESEVPPPLTSDNDCWLSEWHRCILERAMTALHHQEQQSPGNLAHTVLSVKIEFPNAKSPQLAAETSRRCGRPIQPASYRQHLHRARTQLARLLVAEVARTLDNPRPEDIEAELIEVGLMSCVEPYLPPDWREDPVGTLDGPRQP